MKSKTYEEFVEKFKPKKTTDDCYTPPAVYDAVVSYVCRRYGVDPADIVRPFWPGANYQAMEYPAGCVVVDNPPFSIMSKICEWYLERNQPFFLFGPRLTILGGTKVCMKMNHLIVAEQIVYENGAAVPTAFVTNMGDDGHVLEACPELNEAIRKAKMDTRENRATPKHVYPVEICTAAMCEMYARYGIEFAIKKSECTRVSALDEMKKMKKGIFGSGLLLNTAAAARHARAIESCDEKKEATKKEATKKEATKKEATKWQLSDRELGLIREMDEA